MAILTKQAGAWNVYLYPIMKVWNLPKGGGGPQIQTLLVRAVCGRCHGTKCQLLTVFFSLSLSFSLLHLLFLWGFNKNFGEFFFVGPPLGVKIFGVKILGGGNIFKG